MKQEIPWAIYFSIAILVVASGVCFYSASTEFGRAVDGMWLVFNLTYGTLCGFGAGVLVFAARRGRK